MPALRQEEPHGSSKVVLFGGGFLMVVAAIWFLAGGPRQQAAEDAAVTMAGIQNKVAQDAVAQYQITKRNGDAIHVCVQAGLVAAAYLQAKDEANYAKWQATEKQDCAAAGMPR